MVDLSPFIRPGDTVFLGQGTGEPQTLFEALVAQRQTLGPLSIFMGACFTDILRPEHRDLLRAGSYGTLGTTRALAAAGALDIYPIHIARIAQSIMSGAIACDVALVQLSPKGPNGKHSLGPINDYMRAAIAKARVVIAEVNAAIPWTYGAELPALDTLALTIEMDRAPAELASRPATPLETAIAANIASIVPDGATLQVGIGGTIDALLGCLKDRRDLGIHSGTIGDSVLDLIEAGVITNAQKPIDAGVTVTGSLFGTSRLMDAARENPAFRVEPFEYTHAAGILAQIPNLFAINSAVEVDITGQVNAEAANGRYIGAVGGQIDFMHAANAAERGCSIIALPSTAAGGAASRIRGGVDMVTCARADVDFVVTEYGVADLRGRCLRDRIRDMIGISAPAFREALERESHARIGRGF
ncbi:acetyl-CoA hydrolase/transferase family protein [Sphingobium phenoxybenzoativorans]|uniref:Acetyl-CoA hydrolase/transferase family protein n=1 Tax=Sphingobium phenoxybenzoativorans TaxID=1592790 RepID=A0A975Q1U0_9SPHN|nr:acetyl-CoA hydrolase/transferase family protein [Sphingobium phenoxybenzoativorans]QUT05772.1 acetyl-CoA hydrolase/transferase family protein [Sphingobium phenoxybenzoativorans]